MRALQALGAGLCALALAGGPALGADAAGVESLNLGGLEREAVEDALAGRGLRIDPAPARKRIGFIHVVNHEVCSRRDSVTQLLNALHRTTRESIIRRELLLGAGDLYVPALAEESVRNLRDADFSSLVVSLPVVPPAPDGSGGTAADPNAAATVDLLVVTRDVWSLRLNTEFDYGEGTLRALSTSLSENNLFGWRKKVSLAFQYKRGSYAIGPSYLDPNVAGTRLTFSASLRSWYSSDTGEREGATFGFQATYPLFSLASRWGAELSGSLGSVVDRDYRGNNLRLVDLAATPTPEALPYIYRRRSSTMYTQLTRSFGSSVIQRVSGGHELSVVRPSFLPDFPAMDMATRDAFAAAIFPRNERLSSLYLAYGLFTPRYRVYRDFDTYDLREDAILGPSFSLSVSRGADWMGSDLAFTGINVGATWAGDWLDGRQRIAISWNTRVRDGRLVDRRQGVSTTLATPVLGKAVRLVAAGWVNMLVANTRPNERYTVGAENGLRGYATGEFQGQASYLGHVEARTTPLHLAAFRLGAVAFYDVGHAAANLSSLEARQNVGVGIRLLIPQLNFYVLRIDAAVPLQNGERLSSGAHLTRAGLQGYRISAGFRQVF